MQAASLQQSASPSSHLFWQSSTRGSEASTRRSTSVTDSSSHSITAASFHRLQVLLTYSTVSSARAGGCLETEYRERFQTCTTTQFTADTQQRLPNLAFWTKEGVCGDAGVWLHRAQIQQRHQDWIRHIYKSVRRSISNWMMRQRGQKYRRRWLMGNHSASSRHSWTPDTHLQGTLSACSAASGQLCVCACSFLHDLHPPAGSDRNGKVQRRRRSLAAGTDFCSPATQKIPSSHLSSAKVIFTLLHGLWNVPPSPGTAGGAAGTLWTAAPGSQWAAACTAGQNLGPS